MVFGKRILVISCSDRHSRLIWDIFFDFLTDIQERIDDLMDDCRIPLQVFLNFKKGDGSLEGIYHVQGKRTTRYVIVIDIYTANLRAPEKRRDKEILKKLLLETFVHELLHHRYKSHTYVDRKVKEFLQHN